MTDLKNVLNYKCRSLIMEKRKLLSVIVGPW